MIRTFVGTSAIALAACSGPAGEEMQREASEEVGGTFADGDDPRPFSGIAPDQTVRFTGTEPFWGGQVAFTRLTYSTPENPDGLVVAVQRFAGRGGISWSGELEGARFTLAVTPGRCSDGMSDRTYPFFATLNVAGEQRNGCAWTQTDPFTGPGAAE